jgi:hypothetical protein
MGEAAVEKKQVNYTDALQCPRSARLFFYTFIYSKKRRACLDCAEMLYASRSAF